MMEREQQIEDLKAEQEALFSAAEAASPEIERLDQLIPYMRALVPIRLFELLELGPGDVEIEAYETDYSAGLNVDFRLDEDYVRNLLNFQFMYEVREPGIICLDQYQDHPDLRRQGVGREFFARHDRLLKAMGYKYSVMKNDQWNIDFFHGVLGRELLHEQDVAFQKRLRRYEAVLPYFTYRGYQEEDE